MASKYKEYFQMMLDQNKELFKNFKDIHDHYTLEPEKYQKIFNDYGHEILDVVQEWENRLCYKAEGSGYSKYTTNLSEKFRGEVKKYLPKINYIGLQKA